MHNAPQVDDQKGGERRKKGVMKSTSLFMTLILGMIGLVGAGTFSMKFKKVELRTQVDFGSPCHDFGSPCHLIAPETDGELVVDSKKIQFKDEKGRCCFKIPTSCVTSIFYTRVSVHRLYEPIATAGGSVVGTIIGAISCASLPVAIATGVAGLIGSILASSSKSHKHYMVLAFAFEDGNQVGAVEFKLDKKNYRSCLRTIEQVTGKKILYGQEGIQASEHKFPGRPTRHKQ